MYFIVTISIQHHIHFKSDDNFFVLKKKYFKEILRKLFFSFSGFKC